MNVVIYPVRLESGEVLSDLEPADLIPDDNVRSLERSEKPISIPESVQTLVDRVDPTVPEDVRQALTQTLLRFPIVFAQGENDLGRASAVQHRIDTGNQKPFRQPLRRHPNLSLEVIDVHTDSMLQAGLIEPAQSEWASNVVLVRKSDGSMRFCVDYMQLNERTLKQSGSNTIVLYLNCLALCVLGTKYAFCPRTQNC